jgi:Leucine-rich repeat (LRR) protein
MIHFCKNLHYLTTLEWLDASGNNLTDKSVTKLAEAIKGLPNFKCLDLRRNQVTILISYCSLNVFHSF